MTGKDIAKMVLDGAKFTINFQKRTCRVNGKIVEVETGDHKETSVKGILGTIELLYGLYKHSVPSERSESHRHYYFKALPEKELTDKDMMYGEQREFTRFNSEFVG